MAQKSELLINTYAAINSIEARGVFEEYMNFRRTPNNLERFDAQFDATLTTTDLFVRGKIATLIGYPSTYEDIKIAIQRAKRDGEFSPDFLKNIRVTTVPQEELDPKKQINFARYMYFALVKNGANRDVKNPSDDPVVKFVQFLLTSEAQDIFIKHQYYYLPTQNKSLLEMKDTKINSDNSFSMIV